jgi:hypothetical protein
VAGKSTTRSCRQRNFQCPRSRCRTSRR